MENPKQPWARVVMNRETTRFVGSLDFRTFKALEISGRGWETFGFASYRSVQYPAYDLCAGVVEEGAFDIVIAEQVLEHVLDPQAAVRNIYRMLRSGGTAVITTPFLIRLHGEPVDYYRWTEGGLTQLLAAGGFGEAGIATGAWGNRSCVVANFERWVDWVPWRHSLKNEPQFPVVIWAFARK